MTVAAAPADGPRAHSASAERYVTFLVDGQTYAVPALDVREVIRWIPPTRVPNAAAAVKGVMNLRGEIVTVLDLRVRLGLPGVEPTDRTCIVVVTAERGAHRLQAGLVVDTVLDLARIQTGDLEQWGGAVRTPDYVTGVARTKTGLTLLLSVEPLIGDGFSPIE